MNGITIVLIFLLAFAPTISQASPDDKASYTTLKSSLKTRINNAPLDIQTLEMAQQLIQKAEQIYGPDSSEVAYAHYLYGFIYRQRKEYIQAESAFVQAVSIMEKHTYPGEPWFYSYVLNLAAAYEGQKIWSKAVPQFERAISIIEKDKGPESDSLIMPLLDLANAYHLNREHTKSGEVLLRTAAIGEKLNSRYALDQVSHSLNILGNHFLRNGNADQASTVFERRIEILQKLDATPEDVNTTRQLLEKSRQLSGQVKPSKIAASKKLDTNPTGKAQKDLNGLAADSNSSTKHTRLKSPKGYEHIKPAKLYLTEAGHWIVGKSRADAVNIVTKVDRRGTNTWRANWARCLQQTPLCPWKPLQELGYGWFAVITAHAYKSNTHGVDEMIFYGYESSTRQEAIDTALSNYQKKRGHFIIQEMHVGLISEIDWPDVISNYETNGWIEDRDEINYHEACDWTMYGKPYGGKPGSQHDEYGRNIDPLIFTGTADNNPHCVNLFRPSEKLPPPKLVIVPK